ncbi:Sec24d protein [Culex quinquefasciatus]|uniref:Sec24d protein n=1 Tax=Culex quinquefasciatus TaxID=7176 RepID=B0XC53_CULQU|nr:Sec24d protein [Culex quinquefasciatus]|eukprot:XP_001867225.1 Sec24d protein [Culex quinquefasciatus]
MVKIGPNESAPQSPVYNELGLECVVADVSVDLFTMSNPYIDLATIGQISLSVLFRFNLIFRKPISHAAAEERPDQEHLRLIAIDTEMLSVAIEIKYDDKLTDKNVF